MYKYLLCWRYLRSRYIALACIISVMLGVATMIVVNGVMEGFTHKMEGRMHEILSDISFQSRSYDGFENPEWHMNRIRQIVGEDIAGMTPTVNTPALLSYEAGGRYFNQTVQLIGIDERTYDTVGDFGKYLQHPENRHELSFSLRDGGYDVRDHQEEAGTQIREEMKEAGWPHRRRVAQRAAAMRVAQPAPITPDDDLFQARAHGEQAANPQAAPDSDPNLKPNTGAILGIALASVRDQEGRDHFRILPGDDVKLTFPGIGNPGTSNRLGIHEQFTVVDFYESKMSEFDASFVFVPLQDLQRARGMIDPTTRIGRVTSIQIRLKEGADLEAVRDKLRTSFSPYYYAIQTWRDMQGSLLAAIRVETVVLNLLLFMIIAVAGFGILAIFYMIVFEKTRDIGILKSLGASSQGIMGIFLSYGMSLGAVGAGSGLAIGLLIVTYINKIAHFLGWLTGRPLFDPSIYYFQTIPTIIDPLTVGLILGGAMLIATAASILPACRAAMLRPVEALRYE